jgi:hypothetical protein
MNQQLQNQTPMNQSSLFNKIFTSETAKKVWIIIGSVALILALIPLVLFLGPIAMYLFLGVGLIGGVGYKIFVGFPSIFGALTQCLALSLLVLSITSLIFQNQSSVEAGALINKVCTTLHIPSRYLISIASEDGAWNGIFIAIAVGLVAEMATALTAIAFLNHRIGDKIRDAKS